MAVTTGGEVSRFRPRPTFAHGGGCVYLFCLRRPHFFQQRKKWGKERRQKLRFCISLRAMGCGNLILPAARSRKSSCIAPSKDCLSNSAAAADANAEQRFWFYRRNSERQRRRRAVSSSYGTTTTVFCERVGKGRKHAHVIAREEMQERSFCRRSFPHFFRC